MDGHADTGSLYAVYYLLASGLDVQRALWHLEEMHNWQAGLSSSDSIGRCKVKLNSRPDLEMVKEQSNLAWADCVDGMDAG